MARISALPIIALGALAVSAAGAEPLCSGEACQEVTLSEYGGCAWLESTSSHAIAVTVTLNAGGSLAYALEAADLDKARAREAAKREREIKRQAAAQDCQNILNGAKMLEDMRASGTNVPYSPEIEGRAPECRRIMAGENAGADSAASGETVYHYSRYRAIGGDQAVFAAKLVQGSACVPPADIAGYTARYEPSTPDAGN